MSRKQGLISYRNGSKGSFCPKAAAAWHAACACCGTDAETSHQCSAVTAPPPPHDHTMDMATRIFFHFLPANSRFHLSFLPLSPSPRAYKKRRAELFHAEGKYSTFYRVLLQSQPVSFFLRATGTVVDGWASLSSMDHVTSNDKRGSSEKTGRLLQF